MPLRNLSTRLQQLTNSIPRYLQPAPNIVYLFRWLLISLLIGGCTGTVTAFFLAALDVVTGIRIAHPWLLALLPAAGLLTGLAYYYKGRDIAAGNNLLIDTIHKPGRVIPFKMAPFVLTGTLLTHLFGGSAGREGTALQFSAAIADRFSRPLRLRAADRSILILSAAAAGFAAVFGTPLAGAVFGLEFAHTGKLRYPAIFPAFMAAVIADQVTRAWHIQHTSYTIPFLPPLSLLTLCYSIIAGLAFGLCAALFSTLLHRAGNLFQTLIPYAPLRPVAGGLLIACCALLPGTGDYLGLGIPVIEASFRSSLPAYTFGIKLLLTVITLAAGFKGGEVTPLFFIGACLGNALSFLLPLPLSLLAGMGFVAVFAGAANTPLACILMATELFGPGCGVYAAIACVVAYLSSGHTGIYRQQQIGVAKHVRRRDDEGQRIADL